VDFSRLRDTWNPKKFFRQKGRMKPLDQLSTASYSPLVTGRDEASRYERNNRAQRQLTFPAYRVFFTKSSLQILTLHLLYEFRNHFVIVVNQEIASLAIMVFEGSSFNAVPP
jgi:hypothetical protein